MSVRAGDVRVSTSNGMMPCTPLGSGTHVWWPLVGKRFLVVASNLHPWKSSEDFQWNASPASCGWSVILSDTGRCFWRTDEGVNSDSVALFPSLRGGV